MTALVPLTVAFPLAGAALAFFLNGRAQAQRGVSLVTLGLTVVIHAFLLSQVWEGGMLVVHVGSWEAPLGVTLVVDRFAALVSLVSSIAGFCVLLYAIGQGSEDRGQRRIISVFHPTYLILMAGVFNAFITGDLFNLYVSFEVLLTASYVLMTLGATGPRVHAGMTYVVVNVLASVIFLTAIALIYGATGTVNFADLAQKLAHLGVANQDALHLMLLVAFGIKAAIFPLGFWLPDSYPTAAAPVTAVFAGLLTKVGIYAIVRTETLLFPGKTFSELLMTVAFLTLVVGILGALAQRELKRLLSFILVSHMGYMMFGIAVLSQASLTSVIFYIVHHITIQTGLFLVAGLMESSSGTGVIRHMSVRGKRSALLAAFFALTAMNLSGLPPFSGFLGKLGLIQAGLGLNTPLAWLLVTASVVVSLLTLLAVSRVWSVVFWRGSNLEERTPVAEGAASFCEIPTFEARRQGPTKQGLAPLMMIPTASIVALSVALSLLGGPLVHMAERTAHEMTNPDEYIHAVLNTSETKGQQP